MTLPSSPGRRALVSLLAAAAAVATSPGGVLPAAAQDAEQGGAREYVLVSPAGDSLAFELSELRGMLERARALYADLEEDPRVLYTLGFAPAVPVEDPRPAYPWNAVRPRSDSTVLVLTPGNLREADRAYHNYAVMRMREIRTQDPDDPCEALVAREETVLSNFVDGWVLARTLFGGPAFAPLDELAFARRAGHLSALLAARGDRSVGVCADAWAEAHPGEIEAYEAWSSGAFPDLDVPPPDDDELLDDEEPEMPAVPPPPPGGGEGPPPGG